MIAFLAPAQVFFEGLVNGLIYGLVGMGIVIIHRSTKVINFAVGAMGLPGAVLFALLVLQYHFPFWLALVISLLAGTAFATAIELIVIRRLFAAPRVTVLVATIGISQVALATALSLPKIDDVAVAYPRAIDSSFTIGSVNVTGPNLTVLVIVPLLAAALGWLMSGTSFGRRVNASADNSDLARLSGVSPKLVSTIVWTIGGFIATISIILIASRVGNVTKVATLGPATLARGLIVAVIAGLASFPRAVIAGIAVGVVEAVVGFHSIMQPGRIDLLILLTVLVVVYLQSRADTSRERATFSFVPKAKPIPPAIAGRWWVRNLGRIFFVVLLAIGIAAPLIVSTPSKVYLYTLILCFALAALSVSVITGWLGQLSLGQMAFAGLGALGAAALVRGLSLDIGLPGGNVVNVAIEPLTVPLAALLMAIVCAGVAAVIGVGALRVRGLLLGVTTFVFAYACEQYLFRLDIFTGGMQPPVRMPRGYFGSWDLTNQRTYFWLVLAIFAAVVSVVARLRRRGPGRTMLAVRDNADSAAAYTVALTRTRLSGYALAGGMAGLAGGLLGALTQNINTKELFVVGDSLDVVAIAVIGGLGSITGPLVGALWVKGLPAFFPGNDLVPLFSSGIGLLILLLYVPGGLAQIGYLLRDALFARVAARASEPEPRPRASLPARVRERAALPAEVPALAVQDVHVNFGGIKAVDGVDLTVAQGEIVGLIGTNGAGKSTVLNAIGGFVPATGTMQVLGREVSGLATHKRARAGLGRTFQAATLFPELTVEETLLVALEARRRSSLLATALALPTAGAKERRNVADATDVIDFLGLGRYAQSTIGTLSTGTRRIVELAALLALDARMLCLDEPTAGVAQRETEAFGPLIRAIRDQLDASILVIEHDMPLVMGMSDRIYCLERGRVIAEGPPHEVRENPQVIASYLGTDERAINRSGQGAAAGTGDHDE